MPRLPNGWVLYKRTCSDCGADTSTKFGRYVAKGKPRFVLCEECRKEIDEETTCNLALEARRKKNIHDEEERNTNFLEREFRRRLS